MLFINSFGKVMNIVKSKNLNIIKRVFRVFKMFRVFWDGCVDFRNMHQKNIPLKTKPKRDINMNKI